MPRAHIPLSADTFRVDASIWSSSEEGDNMCIAEAEQDAVHMQLGAHAITRGCTMADGEWASGVRNGSGPWATMKLGACWTNGHIVL